MEGRGEEKRRAPRAALVGLVVRRAGRVPAEARVALAGVAAAAPAVRGVAAALARAHARGTQGEVGAAEDGGAGLEEEREVAGAGGAGRAP